MSAALRPGAALVVTIEKAVAGGRMLARHEGQIVLVSGAIPGERVQVRVERVASKVAFAETVDVVDASPERREPRADRACGGAVYAHIAYARQLALKSQVIADAFARIAKLPLGEDIPIAPSPEEGYRLLARLHIKEGRIGFFREGTHELCDPAATRQLLPTTIEALKRVEHGPGAERLQTAIACELCENVPATQRGIVIEFAGSHPRFTDIGGIDGITAFAPFGYGSPYLEDALDVSGRTMTLTHHVRSFFQGNRFLVSHLAERVAHAAQDDDVLDLYAGVGLFSVALAVTGRTRVSAVEGDRYSAADLQTNAARCGGAVTAHQSGVEAFLRAHPAGGRGTIIVDPPRTGVSTEALSGILLRDAHRIIYVSCDVATLARDAKRLLDAGYRLVHIEGFDMFPNTGHVEVLAVLER